MRTTIVPGAALVAVLVAALLPALAAAPHADGHALDRPPVRGVTARADVQPRTDAWEHRVLELTNNRRAKHGLGPLAASSCADGFAEPWTRHLARKQVLVHQDLGPMLGCPHTSAAAENIAYGYDSPRALVSGWMSSPGHRANILNAAYDRLGVAGWVSTTGVTYATQDFLG